MSIDLAYDTGGRLELMAAMITTEWTCEEDVSYFSHKIYRIILFYIICIMRMRNEKMVLLLKDRRMN